MGYLNSLTHNFYKLSCVPIFVTDRPFVFHGFPECESMYLDFPERALGLSKHGHLRLRRMTVPRGEYCADSSDRGHALLGCRQLLAASASFKPTLYGSMFCLGSTFLAITLVLHLWLPELRKSLHSRVLVAHVACLLVSYLGLALVNLATLPAPSPLCSATGTFFKYYFQREIGATHVEACRTRE